MPRLFDKARERVRHSRLFVKTLTVRKKCMHGWSVIVRQKNWGKARKNVWKVLQKRARYLFEIHQKEEKKKEDVRVHETTNLHEGRRNTWNALRKRTTKRHKKMLRNIVERKGGQQEKVGELPRFWGTKNTVSLGSHVIAGPFSIRSDASIFFF